MSYGITSESQLIDITTIKSGCDQYKNALADFTSCGGQVLSASATLDKNALSVDDTSLENAISEIGEQINQIEPVYSNYADQVYADAVKIYNAQVAELNEYRRKLAEQQKNN